VPVPVPGPIVEPLGDGLMAVVPDGLAPAACAAAALPAWLLMPLLPTVLPVVVPVEEPVVVPGVVVTPGELLPVAPPVLVVCASASVLVNANAAASPNVAIRMNYSLSW